MSLTPFFVPSMVIKTAKTLFSRNYWELPIHANSAKHTWSMYWFIKINFFLFLTKQVLLEFCNNTARPIISGSGSITENVGIFAEHHIKEIATKHKSYLQDTPDFLRCIQKINEGEKLDPRTLCVTLDVIGLFTNIVLKIETDSLKWPGFLKRPEKVEDFFQIL